MQTSLTPKTAAPVEHLDLSRIAQDLQIRKVQVESVVQLLDEGNTVPFITRYRKERTGNLNEVVIREIQLRVHRLRELARQCRFPGARRELLNLAASFDRRADHFDAAAGTPPRQSPPATLDPSAG